MGQSDKKEQKEKKKEVSPLKGFILIILFSIIAVCLFWAVRTKQNYEFFYKWVVEKHLFQCASVMILCLMVGTMLLSQFDNKGNLKEAGSKNKDDNYQDNKKPWEIKKLIWKNMNIDFEVVHAAVYGVLFYLSIYQQKIPDFLSHDQTLVAKFNVQLRSVSMRAFSFLWIARVVCQFFNAINYTTKIQYRKAIKMAFELSMLIIEVCMVEILFTQEETFHSLFVPHLKST